MSISLGPQIICDFDIERLILSEMIGGAVNWFVLTDRENPLSINDFHNATYAAIFAAMDRSDDLEILDILECLSDEGKLNVNCEFLGQIFDEKQNISISKLIEHKDRLIELTKLRSDKTKLKDTFFHTKTWNDCLDEMQNVAPKAKSGKVFFSNVSTMNPDASVKVAAVTERCQNCPAIDEANIGKLLKELAKITGERDQAIHSQDVSLEKSARLIETISRLEAEQALTREGCNKAWKTANDSIEEINRLNKLLLKAIDQRDRLVKIADELVELIHAN